MVCNTISRIRNKSPLMITCKAILQSAFQNQIASESLTNTIGRHNNLSQKTKLIHKGKNNKVNYITNVYISYMNK